jgi:hypothetical protein
MEPYMNFSRALIKGSLLSTLLMLASHAHALVVDFESTGITDIRNTYFDSNFSAGSLTTLENVAFYLDGSVMAGGADGIYFSEGVLLDNPSMLQEDEIFALTGGSILYGTGESPSTNTGHNSGLYPGYMPTNTITINIETVEDVTSVGGILINGLNTDLEAGSADYQVELFSGMNLLATLVFNDLESGSVPGSANFFYDSGSDAITKVVITGLGFDFGSPQNNGPTEWDFLIDNIAFNEAVVPVPAALPLFLSALAGIGLFFRRKE